MTQNNPTGNKLSLRIGIPGFEYADLYDPSRLAELNDIFLSRLRSSDPALWERFDRYATTLGEGMKPEEISETIVLVAPHVSTFIADLFGVHERHAVMKQAVERESVIFTFKREFVARR